MSLQDLKSSIEAAAARIGPHVLKTPVIDAPYLSAALDCRVLLKLENIQKTGSFKIRGATNKILQLDDRTRAEGIVTASSGNHGAASSLAAKLTGTTVDIFVPEGTSPAKLALMERMGGRINVHGGDSGQAEQEAHRVAQEEGRTYVSPYNDPDIVAGQGTIGYELIDQVPDMDAVVISVGGGGLASGIAGYIKSVRPEVMAMGCSPQASAAMIASIKAGRIIEVPHDDTLSDGTAGGMDDDSITFDLCRENLDVLETVSEQEIADAFRDIFMHEHLLVEGAAAVTLAALRNQAERFKGKTVVLVMCGANISPEVVKKLL